ncbi:hypothetical protein ACQ4PT_014333 [Festuca glaucescens]
MNNELVRVTSVSVMSNELAVVPFTSASAINDGFVRATSTVGRGCGRGLQMSPSLSGIWDEAVQLYQVQGSLKSVLTTAEGKEIQNEQLVRYLREARHQESQSEDLLSELVYYRIQEELEPEVNGEGSRMDESPGQRHAPRDVQPQVHLFEEDGDSRIGIVDMEQVAEDTSENSCFIGEHSSSVALQIVPYVSNQMVPANTGREFYLELSREIKEHTEACMNMTWNLGFARSWQLAASQVESQRSYFPQRLQVLNVDDIGVLCVPICSQLTSLKTLTIHGSLYLRRDYVDNLTHDNERALLLLTSLRSLEFDKFKHLQSLPAGLQCLTSLQRLSVSKCELITSLPVGGFPASLKDMEIHACSKELTALCREVCRVQKIYFTDGTGDTD